MSIQSNMLSIMNSAGTLSKNVKMTSSKKPAANANSDKPSDTAQKEPSNTAMNASVQVGASSAEYDTNAMQIALNRVDGLQNAKIAQKTNITGGNNGSQIT